MFIQIGGIAGVGKTRITTDAERLAKQHFIKLERVSGSNILRELAGVATIEEMRALSEGVRSKLRPQMYKRLYENDQNDPKTIRLIDGHFIFWDIKGEKYGIQPLFLEDNEQMLAMAVVTADPEIILQRRIKDSILRTDRQLNIDFIIKEQRMEIETAKSHSQTLGVPLAIINNDIHEDMRLTVGKENNNLVSEASEYLLSSREFFEYIKNWANRIKG